jgi:hypothetical protein
MIFRLRYLQHDFELSVGRFVIGRSTECQLSLDDPLVSRKHALLLVTENFVEIKDLGSRNGVLVNGAKIGGPTRLQDGDKIAIGSQDMTILARRGSIHPDLPKQPPRFTSDTMTSLEPVVTPTIEGPRLLPLSERAPPTENQSTSKRDAFQLLGGVAEKSMALGRYEEAERILSALLEHVLQVFRLGGNNDPALVDDAGRFGAKLAVATAKPYWVNYVIELYTHAKRPCSAATIDELHAALRKVKNVDLAALRAYIDMLHGQASKHGPAERFLVQRIEGLERLVTAQ